MKIELDLPVPEGWRIKGKVSETLGHNKENLWVEVGLTFERIEPEIDEELEQAKKLIGKWVKHRNSNARLYLIDEVSRDADNNVVVLSDKCWFYINEITPFPLPVWRCCVSDKPKKDGSYFVQGNGYIKFTADDGKWLTTDFMCDRKWLDEGER